MGKVWQSTKVNRRDHFREVTFKGEISYYSTFVAPNPAPPPPFPPAINNDQSLRLYQEGGNVLN